MLLFELQACRTYNIDGSEIKVINDIFDNLIEEMGMISQFEIPPLPKLAFDSDDVVAYDTVVCNKMADVIEKENRKMRDTTFIIAVFDSLFTCYYLDLNIANIEKQLPERSYIDALNAMKDSSIISYQLNLSKMSRIYFDKEKRVGLIYCSYACGRLCGEEVIICIRKISDKWSIEKTILLGVS